MSSYAYFELLLKHVTEHTWKFLSATLFFQQMLGISTVPSRSNQLGLHLPCIWVYATAAKTTWAMSTLKTGEVPEEVLPLVNFPILMRS